MFGDIVSEGKSRYCWGSVKQITYVSADHLIMFIPVMFSFILWFYKRLDSKARVSLLFDGIVIKTKKEIQHSQRAI